MWAKESKEINIEAFEKGMQAAWYFTKWTPEGNAMARQLAEESIKIEPNSGAYAILAFTHLTDMQYGLSKSPMKSMALAEEFAKKALQLNDPSYLAREALAYIYLYRGQYDEAIAEAKKALDLNPNVADSNYHMGYFLHLDGKNEEAIPILKKAIRLNPYPQSYYLCFLYSLNQQYEKAVPEAEKAVAVSPNSAEARFEMAAVYSHVGKRGEAIKAAKQAIRLNPHPPDILFQVLGEALLLEGQYEEAIEAFYEALHVNPKFSWSRWGLAMAYALLGREKEAKAEVEEFLISSPTFKVKRYEKYGAVVWKNQADRAFLADAMRKAGFPD